MKIIIEAESFQNTHLLELVQTTNESVNLVFLAKSNNILFKVDLPQNIEVIAYENLTYDLMSYSIEDINLIEKVTTKILSAHQTFLLLDRRSFSFKFKNGFGNNNKIAYAVVKANIYLTLYKDKKPKYVYFRSTPHHIDNWIKALICEELGIKILVSDIWNFRWRSSLFLGFRKDRVALKLPEDLADCKKPDEISLIDKYLSKLCGDYENAIPEYEQKRFIYNDKKYYSFYTDVKRHWNRPHYILNNYLCYRKYKKLSVNPIENENYVVYFLQYQPERTSLPEAFGFEQQIRAINLLRACTPKEITIYVKEHPSTFMNKCDVFNRHPYIYEIISKTKGVKLLNLQNDNFQIIDRSILVATLTGTVGNEALARGIPVVYFGLARNTPKYGVEAYSSPSKLSEFILTCTSGLNKSIIKESFRDFIIEGLKYSASGLEEISEQDFNFNFSFEKTKFTSEFKILKYLLQDKIKIEPVET